MAAPMSKHDVDVFDSSYSKSDTFRAENTAWKRLEEQRYKEGYRNGLEIGEEARLQDGHDAGFQQSSCLFHLARIHGSVVAMQRHLCLCDLDDSITASLKADIESLADEVRQLEQAWKQSLMTSAAARCHSNCQPAGNCDSDETDVSECRCNRTSQVVCEPSDNYARVTTCLSDSHYGTTSEDDKRGFPQTDRSPCKALNSDCCDSVVRNTVQTVHACRELTAVKGGTLQSISDVHDTDASIEDCTSTVCDVCREFVRSARVDAFFTNQLQLAQYKSCCSKLDQLFGVFLSASK